MKLRSVICQTIGGYIIFMCSLAIAGPVKTHPTSRQQNKPAVSRQLVHLGKVTVQGHKLGLIAALRMVRQALKEPYSPAPGKEDRLVCRFTNLTGTHFKILSCATNREITAQRSAIQLAILSGGPIPVEQVDFRDNFRITESQLHKAFRALDQLQAKGLLPPSENSAVSGTAKP